MVHKIAQALCTDEECINFQIERQNNKWGTLQSQQKICFGEILTDIYVAANYLSYEKVKCFKIVITSNMNKNFVTKLYLLFIIYKMISWCKCEQKIKLNQPPNVIICNKM